MKKVTIWFDDGNQFYVYVPDWAEYIGIDITSTLYCYRLKPVCKEMTTLPRMNDGVYTQWNYCYLDEGKENRANLPLEHLRDYAEVFKIRHVE